MIADYEGDRYLVAMLGEGTAWCPTFVRTEGGRSYVMADAKPYGWKTETLEAAPRSCAGTCRSHPEPAPTSRSTALPTYPSSKRSRRDTRCSASTRVERTARDRRVARGAEHDGWARLLSCSCRSPQYRQLCVGPRPLTAAMGRCRLPHGLS
jgi:hypothetical protein